MRVIDLGSVSATGVSGSFVYAGNIPDYAKPTIGVQVVATGDPLTITVDIEGSLDGTNWFVINTHAFIAGEISALGTLYHIVDKPVQHIRANVSALTFTTAATVATSIFVGR